MCNFQKYFYNSRPQRTSKYLHAAFASNGDIKEINCGAFAKRTTVSGEGSIDRRPENRNSVSPFPVHVIIQYFRESASGRGDERRAVASSPLSSNRLCTLPISPHDNNGSAHLAHGPWRA